MVKKTDVLNKRFLVLKAIGEYPYYSKEELAEFLGISKNVVSSVVSHHRRYARIVKAPSYDQKNGIEWALTGKGYREVIEGLREIEDELNIDISIPSLYQFKPTYTRERRE